MGPAQLAAAIARHYAAVKRDLPWRRRVDPYATWVSEIMLQQTRVATVIPYWERWMARFPSVGALAAAPLDAVLAAWAGLGYYSRARNLHRGAKAIAADFGGALPARAAELRAVPGIGPYTAGAIASIAFGERTPLVDGNVARVLARVYAIDADIKSTPGQRELWARAGALVDALPRDLPPGDLNQGLMELGATVCSKSSPRCALCPIAAGCAAERGGTQDRFPIVAKRKPAAELPLIERAALWLDDGAGHIILARRVPDGLFGGLWELPQGASRAQIARACGVAPAAISAAPVAYHDQTLTHRRLRIEVFAARAPRSLVDHEIPGYDAIDRISLAAAPSLGIAASTTAILTKYEDTPWSSTQQRSPSSPRATTRSSRVSPGSATRSTTRTSATPRSARQKASTSSSTTRGR